MSKQWQTQTKNIRQPSFTPVKTGLLQRQCACGQHTGGGECAECRQKREGMIQRAVVSPSPMSSVPPIVHDVLSSQGQPLDAGTRSFMEPRFGYDFSSVRVHTDAKAAESARAVNALAYTVGQNIVFRSGQYTPASAGGQRLLAHELTHVLQQRPGSDLLQRTSTETSSESKMKNSAVQVTHVNSPTLSRQRFPGVISRCKEMGVPCPAPGFFNGQACRLMDCYSAVTARLPGAISPGVCVYYCEDGTTCACVLVGTRTSAICTFRFCSDKPGLSENQSDLEDFAVAAVDAYQQQNPNQPDVTGDQGSGDSSPALQAKLEINQPGDLYEREADHISERVMRMPDPAQMLH